MRNKQNEVSSVDPVQRLTDKRPERVLFWGRIAVASFSVAFASAIGVAYFSANGHVPLSLRSLLALSGTMTLYAVRRTTREPDTRLLHGSAHWSTSDGAELLTLTHSLPVLPSRAFFLGMEEERLISLPGSLAQQHGIIVGGTGTGKTRGFFLPNAAFARGESLLCTDPKGELWRYTSGFHAKATRYAPTEPDASGCFNWVPLCTEARYAELCARTLIEAGENRSHPAEAIWIEAETAFLAALFAHATTLPTPTPLTAYYLFARQKQADLMEQLHASSSSVAREQAYIFEQTSERMRGSIVPAVAAKLQFLRDPKVARFTSANTMAPDFGRLRRRAEAVYWCLSEADMIRLRPLTSLFFTLVLEQIANAAPPDCAEATPVRALLDEFANIGTLPQFDTTISLARSRGLSLWLGIQSLSQLEDRYGRAAAKTILANSSTKIVLAGLDVDSAEYVSRSLGETTVVADRRSWNLRQLFGRTGSVGHFRTETRRALLTPDEVRRIGKQEALVITSNRSPVRLQRFFYAFAPVSETASALGEAQALLPQTEQQSLPSTSPAKTLPSFPEELLTKRNAEANPSPSKPATTQPFQILRPPRMAQRIPRK